MNKKEKEAESAHKYDKVAKNSINSGTPISGVENFITPPGSTLESHIMMLSMTPFVFLCHFVLDYS